MSANGPNSPKNNKAEMLESRIRAAAEAFALGKSLLSIAMKMETSTRNVRRWLRSPVAQEIIEDIRQANKTAISQGLHRRTKQAIAVLKQLLQSDSELIRTKAVSLVLRTMTNMATTEELQLLRQELEGARAELIAAKARPIPTITMVPA